ncbi:MAG: hypothetical protein K8T89_18755 [Planctomycetes bacterium]|nr:hypothetical protein [Planctomycetota bacterium]
MITSIGIIGQGFVGGAVREGLRPFFNIWTYDKRHGTAVYRGDEEVRGVEPPDPARWILENIDGPVFVCLPTPMQRDGGSDTSIVEETIAKLDEAAASLGRSAVAVIKSTIPPGTTERLNTNRKALTVCFSPEFLREATFLEDFLKQDRIVIGGPPVGVEVVAEVFRQSFPNVPLHLTNSTIAEMVKYVTNCFLAVKVSLGNELKGLCDRQGIDYSSVMQIATLDARLGTSHWAVPGPDGKPGFGGSCFPKDLNALMFVAAQLGALHHTMRGAWETNLEIRPDRDWEQLHGRAVNYK